MQYIFFSLYTRYIVGVAIEMQGSFDGWEESTESRDFTGSQWIVFAKWTRLCISIASMIVGGARGESQSLPPLHTNV